MRQENQDVAAPPNAPASPVPQSETRLDGAHSWQRRRFVVVAGRCLSVAVAAVTLLGFTGRWLWLGELASHFRIQYFVAAVLGAAVLAALRQWRSVVVHCGAAVANAAVVAVSLGWPAPATAIAPVELRLLMANVYYANSAFDRLLSYVQQVDPDVVVFLEVSPAWDVALTALAHDYPYHASLPRKGSFGIAVYSRRPLSDMQILSVLGTDSHLFRGRLQIGDRPLTLIRCHPGIPDVPSRLVTRNRQLDWIAGYAQTEAEAGEVVLLGDLNTTPWSPYFSDLLRRSGLRDSRRGFGVQRTWPVGDWWWLLGIPLDHCLVSRGLTVLDRRVGPDIGSDHLPIYVDLAVAPQIRP